MYERFYGFGERPFTLLPDPDFLFLSEKHSRALDLLEMAIFNASGFCVISGDIGAGKTTLIRELLNRLDDKINVGLVSNTHPSFGELMQWIMAAYGLPVGSSDRLELHKRFIDYTIEIYAGNRHTLLIVDEAQNLSIQALEELRMLSNVNSDKDLVLQVILIGQQQLREKLLDPRLEQFAQRIALDYHLETLNAGETRSYIQHRLQHAGGRRDLFTDNACSVVYRVTYGIPRLINRVCDLSLVYGYSAENPQITAEIVEHVAEDQRMGRLFGDQEQLKAAELQPVTLKAVGARTVPRVETVAVVTTEPVGQANDAAGPVEKQRSIAPAADSAAHDATPPAASRSVSDEVAKSPDCDAVHISDAGSGLTSDLPEKAAEPQITAEVTMPMNNKKTAAPASEPLTTVRKKTIAHAMNSILPPEMPAAGAHKHAVHRQPDTPDVADDLHTLVVDAEKRQRAKGERGALWLLVGVVAMVAGTGWMTRDIWLGQTDMERQAAIPSVQDPAKSLPAAIKREVVNDIHQPVAVSAAPEVSSPEVGSDDSTAIANHQPEPVAETPVTVAEVSEPEPETVVAEVPAAAPQPLVEATAATETVNREVPEDSGRLVETEVVEAVIDPAAQDADLQREAERLARLQEETQRLEKERQAAEIRLAKQRAARQALERRTRLEQERIRAAEKTVAKVAVDRARVEKQLNEATQKTIVAKPSPVETAAKPAAKVDPVPVEAASVAVFEPGKIGNKVVSVPVEKTETVAEDNGEVRFSNNPCSGPTARFMSTCR